MALSDEIKRLIKVLDILRINASKFKRLLTANIWLALHLI